MKPIIFLVPVIALILVAIIYRHFLKVTTGKKDFRRFIFISGSIGFVLNLLWELMQMPLYKNGSLSFDHVVFCGLGAVADAIMLLLLYLILALTFKNPFWVYHLTWSRAILAILLGGSGAILSEMRHISIGSWAYADSMPIIFGLNVGISPVLQFMILPLLTYFISSRFVKITNSYTT